MNPILETAEMESFLPAREPIFLGRILQKLVGVLPLSIALIAFCFAFEDRANSQLTIVHSFGAGPSNGAYPGAGLTLGANGNFYGATRHFEDRGFPATVFKLAGGTEVRAIHLFRTGSVSIRISRCFTLVAIFLASLHPA